MPKTDELVIDTSPLIALVAAWGNLTWLPALYDQVWVPFEVCQEILKGGISQFAVSEFEEASWLNKKTDPLNRISLFTKRPGFG